MASFTVTSTPNPFGKRCPALAILADANVQDPKPATLREILGCEYILYRISDMPAFLRFTAPPGTLQYMVIACLSPLVADYAGIENPDDREVALGEFCLRDCFCNNVELRLSYSFI